MNNTPSDSTRIESTATPKVGERVNIALKDLAPPTSSKKKLTARQRAELFKAWEASEEVAMHFNNLLSGFRLKAIGGVAVGAVVGVGLKSHLATPFGECMIFFSLTTIWALVWAADFLYYYRLLAGAVDELLRLERELGDVLLSHAIELRIQGKKITELDVQNPVNRATYFRGANSPCVAIKAFYLVPFLLLLSATGYFAWNWLKCPA